MVRCFNRLVVGVSQVFCGESERFSAAFKHFKLVTLKKAVALGAKSNAVFPLFNNRHNVPFAVVAALERY